MTNLYKSRYRIPSARAQWWNYGADAAYFITVCTEDRIPYFGRVVDGLMQLSEIDEIVKKEWLKTPELRRDMNLILDEWIIMPNHFHGIIVIGENRYNKIESNVETQCIASLQKNDINPKPTNKFGPQSKNLASIIRGFKIGVTKSARLTHADFAWQSRYHDRIIRDQPEHERIVSYIQDSPINWEQDEMYV